MAKESKETIKTGSPAVLEPSSKPVIDDYRIRDDSRDLERAAEVMSDPLRHRAAKKHLMKKTAALHKHFLGARRY